MKAHSVKLISPLLAALLVCSAQAQFDLDADGDGVSFFSDNCTEQANPDQRDTDEDGFGNRCDVDFDQNCIHAILDLGILKSVFFTAGDTEYDINGDHIVNATDLGLFKSLYFFVPGPSGVPNNCNPSGVSPFANDVHIRGSWNQFDLTPESQLIYLGDRLYTTVLTLDSGEHLFRITGSDFDDAARSCGGFGQSDVVIPGESLAVDCGTPFLPNLVLDLTQEADGQSYRFIFDVGTPFPGQSVIVIPELPLPAVLPGDTQAPTFAGAPSLDQSPNDVSFTMAFDAAPTDDGAIAFVDFLLDGTLIWRDYTPPYSGRLDTITIPNGSYTLTATARDANGNTGVSPALPVTINNPNFGVFSRPMFVRGAFVDDASMQFNTENRLVAVTDTLFEAVVRIDRSENSPTEFAIGFKIADEGWSDGYNCGRPIKDTSPFFLGDTRNMPCAADAGTGMPPQNISLFLIGEPQPADYLFVVDAEGFPATDPTVTVTLAPLR